jgi:Reverse transcriptase (RNA-dependent DNA polymerase)
MLQKSLHLTINVIYDLFIASLRLIHIPNVWRGARVVFIPKLGQLVYTLAKSFRPISLTSFMLKALEKLIDRFLRDGILKQFQISCNQHAYQPCKSAESALHQIVNKIEKALNHGQFALGGFVDLSNAFSNMTFFSITQSCFEHSIDCTTTSWIYAMLSSRIVTARLNSVKISIFISKGCPQGGVLPPLLFILVKDSLLKLLNDSGYFSQSFADDLSVILIGLFVSTLCDLMQAAFAIIENWCIQHEQVVNTDKTKLILFTKKRKIIGFKAPTIFGKEINLSQSAKVLGLLFDPKLSWNDNTEYRCRKAISTLWMCRSAFGKNWGLSPKVLTWIYTAIVRPVIAYAAFIWWPRCQLGSVQSQLSKVQRLAIISITGALKTTPTAALEALLNIEPLHIHVEAMARATCIRFNQSSLLVKSNFGHAKLWYNLISESPHLNMPHDKIQPAYRFDRAFNVHFPSRTDWRDNSAIPSENSITWFSDGSRRDDRAGSGIFCPQTHAAHSFPLGRLATIFQAETFGIWKCSLILLKNDVKDQHIYISRSHRCV